MVIDFNYLKGYLSFVLSFVSRRPFQLYRRTRKRKQIPFSDPLQTKSMMGHPSKENQRPHPLGLPSERSNLCSHAARRRAPVADCRRPFDGLLSLPPPRSLLATLLGASQRHLPCLRNGEGSGSMDADLVEW